MYCVWFGRGVLCDVVCFFCRFAVVFVLSVSVCVCLMWLCALCVVYSVMLYGLLFVCVCVCACVCLLECVRVFCL